MLQSFSYCYLTGLLALFLKDALCTKGYESGAPLKACNTLMPLHSARPSQLPQPYFLRVYDQLGNPVTEYKPGDKRALRIEIQGAKLRGFILQARVLSGSGRRIGQFLSPLPRNVQYLNCDYNNPKTTVTHESERATESIKLWWRPPEFNVGPLHLIASVVQSKDLFWTWITSPTIYPHSDNLTVDTSRCGRGFGCFQLGKSGCRSESNCDFTFSWKCTTDTVIFEFLGKTASKLSENSDNYAGLGYSVDRGLDDTEVLACMFQEESNPTLSTFYTHNKMSKKRSFSKRRPADQTELVPLKMSRDKNRFLCRFEQKQKRRSTKRSFDRKGYHFFVHKTGYYSDKTVIPFRGFERLKLCSHPDLFVETESSASSNYVIKSILRLLFLLFSMTFISSMTCEICF